MKPILRYWDNEVTELEYLILRCFFPEGTEKTMKEVQKRAGYSYERINTSLKNLKNKKIISEKQIGKTFVYSLNFQKGQVQKAFHSFAIDTLIRFSNKHSVISKAIREILEEPVDMVIIFGSYSKGTQTKNSDIDLLCTSFKKKQIEDKIASLKHKYNLKFNAIVIQRTEFKKIKEENKELWEDLVNYGIIFQGYDLFYYWAYKG